MSTKPSAEALIAALSGMEATPKPQQPGKRRPACPRGLRAGGRRLWADITSKYDGFGQQELDILHAACRCLDHMDRLDEVVGREGMTVTSARGVKAVHPAVREHREQAKTLSSLIASLRLPVETTTRSGEQVTRRPQTRRGARGSYGTTTTALRAVN